MENIQHKNKKRVNKLKTFYSLPYTTQNFLKRMNYNLINSSGLLEVFKRILENLTLRWENCCVVSTK